MKKKLRSRFGAGGSEDSVNPMESVANLADVMIVLAVGIMLALIINWNVDIGVIAYKNDATLKIGAENALVLDEENIEEVRDNEEKVDSEDMERFGTVYFDESSGKYYIIVD